jgi:N-glycosylase/DNA lyase
MSSIETLLPNTYECAGRPFHLAATVTSGQNFRWRQEHAGVWWGVTEQTVIAAWQEENNPDGILRWQTFPDSDQWDVVSDYFRLDIDLEALYTEWIRIEPRIAESLQAYRGMRVLRQSPIECFFAFQCAACNTVVKIERSVRRLAERYGEPIHVSAASAPFYQFPTLKALAEAEEQALRADFWGYRAPRVIALARHLQSLPMDWLNDLRTLPYQQAHEALTALHGIGAKLEDCICLFALDKDEAVPIDTHTRQIAVRLFLPVMADRSLTPRAYAELANSYRARFGPFAGWAQQYLFFGELRRSKKINLSNTPPLCNQDEEM